jgi:hypothetical protein
VSLIDLEHGIWRAKDAGQTARRRQFFEDLFAAVPICHLTFAFARRAGRIDGESRRRGVVIPFQDLVIGVNCAGVRLRCGDGEHPSLPDDSKPAGKTALRQIASLRDLFRSQTFANR